MGHRGGGQRSWTQNADAAARVRGAVDCLTTAMVVEELAKGDMGVSVVFAQTLKLIQSFQAAANEDQRARFLPAARRSARAHGDRHDRAADRRTTSFPISRPAS